MKKSILEIYALAVCFVTVVCAAVAVGIGVYNIIEIAAPEFTLWSYEHNRHQSNEAFFRDAEGEGQGLSEEAKTKRRLDSYAIAVGAERRNGVQSLVMVSIVFVIDAFVFGGHWILARRVREPPTA